MLAFSVQSHDRHAWLQCAEELERKSHLRARARIESKTARGRQHGGCFIRDVVDLPFYPDPPALAGREVLVASRMMQWLLMGKRIPLLLIMERRVQRSIELQEDGCDGS